ncbi:FlgD immunoglobulin-like domain containing protein [Desulfospira joergensenii]|uniref:FlgD immunoglobulin-like domain containing protein n=1 Tax=Desulfospira joergensenii TaxID=53329 RepID=UPI0003B302C8|nr:FlgD immunoglobulin-like domain containing protein [Desulfospira joergensenii]
MSISTSGNSSLDTIRASYQTTDSDKAEKEDTLGRDSFLTMLVAQLQNQDPLNPMDGTDFSSQLAQFSQLEQLMNLNESMENLATSSSNESEKDLVSYMGKQVTGEIDTMEVENGAVSSGFYNLTDAADVIINITDESGQTVRTLYQGTNERGAHLISWDGTDTNGDAVDDGSYTYTVLANTGSGYQELPTTVTGVVEGIAYSNGNPYLVVQGLLMSPGSLTSVADTETETSDNTSILDYLGKTVTSEYPIISVEDGVMEGTDLEFSLEQTEEVTIKIYDVFDDLVQTITLDEEDVAGGENAVHWDGVGSDGYHVDDGLYYYKVSTSSGTAKTSVTEEVSGIKYANGTQYLVLKDSGRLVAVSNISEINN